MNNTQQAASHEDNAKMMQAIYEKHKAAGLMQYPERIFKMMKEYADFICQPQAPAPAPDAVEAKGRMDAEEFWQTNIGPNNANKDFVVPSWTLNFAEKYAAYLAGHAEGQKATVEAKSAGEMQTSVKLFTEKQVSDVWDNAYYRASYDIHKPPTDPPLTKELYIKTLHPPTSHAEGEKGAVGYWQRRCELAEAYLHESPCDPDITTDQTAAWEKYRAFIKENET